jgi:hypothetical protein
VAFLPYSETFLKTVAANEWRIYTVPEGMRAVLRSITVTNPTGNAAVLQVLVAGVLFWHAELPVAKGSYTWEVRSTAYGGEAFAAYQTHPGMSVTLAGFIFNDPSGANGPPHGAQQLPAIDYPRPEPPAQPRGGQ